MKLIICTGSSPFKNWLEKIQGIARVILLVPQLEFPTAKSSKCSFYYLLYNIMPQADSLWRKIVDITYNDRPKLFYYTINLGGQNMVEKGQKFVENRQK